MAQMGTVGTIAVSGATMGAMSAATAGSIPFLTLAFQAVGLGFLLVLPAIFYQILFIIVLGFTMFSSYYSYRFHKNWGPLGLALIGSLLLYASIYYLVSEFTYWIAFSLMSTSAGWSYMITKKQVKRPQPHQLTLLRQTDDFGTS